MRLRSRLLGTVGAVAMMAGAGSASAQTTTSASSNWAGYAVHGTTFKKVIGRWTVPSATCGAGEATYSATWVGIGGYSEDSDALEQIGTELDCTAAGKVKSTAWMELVPVEAPSVCASSDQCQTLPLADFETTRFSRAEATSTSGHTGTITDRRWDATKIALETDSGAPGFVSERQGGDSAAATASALSAGGSAFSVSYETTTAPSGPVAETARQDVRASSSDTRLMPALRMASPAG
jgi:hypothetical protein